MKIAIVNDMLMAVEILRRIVLSVAGHSIAWIARDGAEAVQKCAESRPDLILMDLIMPVMDGVEATRRIMSASPCAILVVTSNVTTNSNSVYEAMGFGALDAVNTPTLDKGLNSEAVGALLAKIYTISLLIPNSKRKSVPPVFTFSTAHTSSTLPPLIAIGASTGGPKALAALLGSLPPEFNAAIVVIQHIDQVFAGGLSTWLGQQTSLKVRTAEQGRYPTAGIVDVAATNDHLVLDASGYRYTREPLDLPFRPSVDVFFSSIAPLPKKSVIGVLLTGIGADGAQGMLKLRNSGHHTIAQDEASSVVYGMPKAAVELNAATDILPCSQIALRLQTLIPQTSPPKKELS